MKIHPSISVIIVSYNVEKLLLKCLQSLYRFKTSEIGLEIIVVDNNSNDGTVEKVRAGFSEVIVIQNKFNAGFSAANNQGMEICIGDFIFLLNPDTEITSNCFSMMMDACTENGERIVAPRLLNTNGTLQISVHKFPGILSVITETFYLHKLLSAGNYSVKSFADKFNPDWASGAALFFRKEVYKQVGLMDVNLFWMDDVDYCYRARKNNIYVNYIPKVEIYHHSGKSSEKNLPVTIANQLLSKIKYLTRHKGILVGIVAALFVFIHIITRIVVFLILSIFGSRYHGKMKAYLFALKKFVDMIFHGKNEIARN